MSKILAETLVAGDIIVVTLAAVTGGPTGARTPISAMFNHAGQQLDPNTKFPATFGQNLDLSSAGSGKAPEFPLAAFTAALQQNNGIPSAKSAAIQAQYEAAVEAWQDNGGSTVTEGIASAVMRWAEQYHGVKTQDGPHPYINPDDVIVRPAYRAAVDTPTVFSVQLAPVWG